MLLFQSGRAPLQPEPDPWPPGGALFASSAGGGSPPAPTLNALTLSSASFSEGATAGTVIGAIQGLTAGSTVTVTPNDGRVAIAGSNLVVGLSAASAGTFDITLRETLAGASNSPRDTTITLTVIAAPALQTFEQDFVTFGGGVVPTLDAAWNYTGHNTGSAYGTGENNSSRLRSFATGPRLGMDRGLQIEPAATNLATNPRMTGATASVFSGFASKALGSNPAATTQGSRYITITDVAHGRAVGDRVYYTGGTAVAGLTLFNSANNAYNICKIIDANSYVIYHYGATTASATTTGGGTPSAWYALQSANVFPNTFSQRAVTDLAIRLIAVSDGGFGTVPSSIGALREIEIAGSGSGTQYFTSTAAVQGDTLTFSQIAYGDPRAADWFLLENTTTVSLVIDEFDSGGTFLTSHAVDFLSQIGSFIYTPPTITAQCTNPACASVRAGWAISAGANPADFRFQTFEHSLSKTSWRPSIALPAPAATGSVTRAADVLSCSMPFSVAAQGALEIEFDCQEIVGARDCVWSIGSLRLTVVGSSYPRDLELTDGGNVITLPGVIVRDWLTQQMFRAVASWGPGGLGLACGEFLSATQGSVGSYASEGTTQTLYLGQRADGSEKSACWIKYIRFQNNERSLASLLDYSRWTHSVDPAKWPNGIPGITLAVGRQTPGAFAAVIATDAPNGVIVNPNSTAYGITITGAGSVSFNTTTKLITLSAGVTSLAMENVDMRGCALLYSMGTQLTLTVRNCAFDQPLGTTATIDITSILNNSASLIEYCDFYPGANTAFLMHVQGLNANHTVRRNRMYGSVADFANMVGGVFQENLIIEGAALPLNKHADAFQCNGTSLADVLFKNNVIDGRRRRGTGTDPNSAEIVASTNGPISHSFVSDSNIYVGFTNPIQYRARIPSIGVGGITLWRSGATITVRDDLFDMSSLQYLDIKMGTPITISGSSFSISGTALILAKLGLEAQTNVTTYTSCAIFETQLANSSDAITPATGTTPVAGPLTGGVRRLSLGFAVGDSITIGGQTFTAVASGAVGNNQFNVTTGITTLSALLAQIATATGLTVSLGSPILPTVSGNKSLLRGTAISSY